MFDKTPISFEEFSNVLSILGQKKDDDRISYYYPSAGGLYPIDVYIYIKQNRVSGLDEGLYYYHPPYNRLHKISNKKFGDEIHYSINKATFNESAFSVYFIYNAGASMPKYGGLGYFYACIDTGIMVATLNALCEKYNIGICCIGDMNYSKIQSEFSLDSDKIFLHCIECGKEK